MGGRGHHNAMEAAWVSRVHGWSKGACGYALVMCVGAGRGHLSIGQQPNKGRVSKGKWRVGTSCRQIMREHVKV